MCEYEWRKYKEEASEVIDLIEFRSNFLIEVGFKHWIFVSKVEAQMIAFLISKLFNKLFIFCLNYLDRKLVIKFWVLHLNNIFIHFISFFRRKISFINLFPDAMVWVLALIIMSFRFSQFHEKIDASTVIEQSFKSSMHQNRIVCSDLKTKLMRTLIILSVSSKHDAVCKFTKSRQFCW